MAIEGRSYALPKAVADEFESRWLAELKKGRRSAAAGEMCRTMTGHLIGGVDYPGRAATCRVSASFSAVASA